MKKVKFVIYALVTFLFIIVSKKKETNSVTNPYR